MDAGLDWDDKLRLQRDIIQLAIDALRPILVKMRPHVMVLASYPSEDAKIEVDGKRAFPIPGLKNSDVASFMSEILKKEHRRRHEDIKLAKLTLEVMVTGQAFRVMLPVYREGLGWVVEPNCIHRTGCTKTLAAQNSRRSGISRDWYLKTKWTHQKSSSGSASRESQYTKQQVKSDTVQDYEYDERRMLFRGPFDTARSRYGAAATQGLGQYETNVYDVHTAYLNDAGGGGMTSTGERRERKSLKYPFGRQVIMINHQYIAVDQPNPFWHGDYRARRTRVYLCRTWREP